MIFWRRLVLTFSSAPSPKASASSATRSSPSSLRRFSLRSTCRRSLEFPYTWSWLGGHSQLALAFSGAVVWSRTGSDWPFTRCLSFTWAWAASASLVKLIERGQDGWIIWCPPPQKTQISLDEFIGLFFLRKVLLYTLLLSLKIHPLAFLWLFLETLPSGIKS